MTERFRHIALMVLMALLAVGCANEEYVGDKALQDLNEKGKPVSFDLIAAPQTRAQRTGADAADDLNGSFVVYGQKNYTSAPSQVVFDNYFVVWGDNSAHTSTSNSAGWEYVGYYSLPATGTSGHTGFPELKPATAPANRHEQSIKYWDFSANKYDFLAYSLGKGVTIGETTTYADASAIEYDATDGYTYDLSGTNAQLAACYISDLEKKNDQSANNTQVQLTFRKLGARVRIAFYETIPGYSVKDVKFYQSATAESSGTTAYLFGAAASIPNEGTFTITFNNDGKPVLDWTKKDGTTGLTYISFGDAVTTEGTTWTGWANHDYLETDEAVYIGRFSNQATGPANFVTVLPNPDPQPLNLKVDYTLLTRDGYGETIDVKGATAVVPAQYAAWQPNCSYTYIFKISDNTDGQTGSGSTPVGLSPITLDAVVNVDAEGRQETVTTVTSPSSITTYQDGSDFATDNVYKAGDIYIMVNNGETLTVGTNANLYRAEVTGSYPNITESSVANALATNTNPATGTDENGNAMTVTRVENSEDDQLTTLDNNTKAVFTATAGTTYVFEYIDGHNDKFYKVIKVMVE